MNKELFSELVESVKESGAIMRGEKKPSRSFNLPDAPRLEVEKRFAVCVMTDDPELLVLRKVYQVEVIGDRICAKDEAGETAVYPADYFILLELPREAEEALLRCA
ncbi:MAG: hypothetical protein ICV68_08195 [Pyrinomonadaceae bacterium]|nr:hypothetical protein [Pyrinomonadaceae bacterium]